MARTTITKEEIEALKELVMRGLKAGVPEEVTPETVAQLLAAGLNAQDRFVTEMVEGKTNRAKIGMLALTASIHADASAIGSQRRLMEYAENVTA